MITYDAGGRQRVSQLKTLHDGKLTTGHNALIFEQAGTGSHTLSNAKNNMVVDEGEWCVFTSRRNLVYSAGKSQPVEVTFDRFAPQAGVVKRVGYFDASADSPYDAGLDGFWLETTDTTIKLVVKHADINTPRQEIDITNWTGYKNLGEMKDPSFWNGFTVLFWDFLWLGGANLRLFVMTSAGFILAHQYIHADGNRDDTMIKYPSKPIRYEIRSTTGSGQFRYICSQGATEGDINDNGYARPINVENITAATAGTIYPILGIRKNMSLYKHAPVSIEDIGITPYSVNDRVIFSLQINPILSEAPEWDAFPNSAIEYTVGNGTITVGTPGVEIAAGTAISNLLLSPGLLTKNFLSYIGHNLDGSSDEYFLCIKPQTNAVSMNGLIVFKEF